MIGSPFVEQPVEEGAYAVTMRILRSGCSRSKAGSDGAV